MIVTPQCFQCRHMVKGQGSFSCPAFDGEIPDAIVLNDHDHRQPYPGDGGYRFTPKEDDHGRRFEPHHPRSDEQIGNLNDDDRPE